MIAEERFLAVCLLSVPDSKSRNIPEVVVAWPGQLGFGDLEGVG
jgi:hypothetical protein